MFTLGDVLASKNQLFPVVKSGTQVIAEIDAKINGIRQRCASFTDEQRTARRAEIDTRLAVIEPLMKELEADFEYISDTYEGCDWCCGGGDERWAENEKEYKPLEEEQMWLKLERDFLTPA